MRRQALLWPCFHARPCRHVRPYHPCHPCRPCRHAGYSAVLLPMQTSSYLVDRDALKTASVFPLELNFARCSIASGVAHNRQAVFRHARRDQAIPD